MEDYVSDEEEIPEFIKNKKENVLTEPQKSLHKPIPPKVGKGVVENNTTPFPLALEKPNFSPYGKKGSKTDVIWETLRQVKINLPVIDVLKQILAYERFMKDMCTQKRSHKLPKKIKVGGHVSVVLTNTLPPKLKDPEAPIIPIEIGNITIKRALLDLGASVNILPGLIFDKTDFGTLQKLDTILELADHSTKVPTGMLIDLIVRVEDLITWLIFLFLTPKLHVMIVNLQLS